VAVTLALINLYILTKVKVKVMLRLTVSQSVCLDVKFTLGLVNRYYFLSEICRVVSVGRTLWREVGSVSCQSLSAVFSPLSKFNIITFYMSHMFYVYTRPLSAQAQYSRSCQNICSLRYSSNLDTWTVVSLTPVMLSLLGFALPYIIFWPYTILVFLLLYYYHNEQ
jgi:hypothetical protein